MPNKIASIILNSAKSNGLCDVFVAQPDFLTEKIAGKFFLLATLNGKKTDTRKVFDFLVQAFKDNYYNDEKLSLCGKIEGLKINNIFEAAITKTNKDLYEFIISEKLKIDLGSSNLTLGAACDNKLFFSNFGSNRALLIFNRGQKYEVINVEANAAEATESEIKNNDLEAAPSKNIQFFSSVINGEMPDGAYFVFVNEALPEYLSTREMIEIITKLAPIVASEQIKNVLTKINNYVPFLGVLIKNTTNLGLTNVKDDHHDSHAISQVCSSLNHTEERTERVLAPAGLISAAKIKTLFAIVKRYFRLICKNIDTSNTNHQSYSQIHSSALEEPLPTSKINIGEVKSLRLARSDSFLVKEKIFFKKKNNFFLATFKRIPNLIWQLLDPHIWQMIYRKNFARLQGLDKKRRFLFVSLIAIFPIFIGSILFTNWQHQLKNEQENVDRSLQAVSGKLSDMNISFLYSNQEAANKSLSEARSLISSLARPSGSQADLYDKLQIELKTAEEKLNKIIRITTAPTFTDVTELNIKNIVLTGNKIFAANNSNIYEFPLDNASSSKIELSGFSELSAPFFDKIDRLYFRNGQQLAQLNTESSVASPIGVNEIKTPEDLKLYEIFNTSLYALSGQDGKIYKYRRNANNFTGRSLWLTEEMDLSNGRDLFIDGDIYVLLNNAQIIKLFKGKKIDYNLSLVSPAVSDATKLSVRGDKLYILDSSTKRLIIYNKQTGELIKQYILEFTDELLDFSFDDSNKLVYILDKKFIYRLALD